MVTFVRMVSMVTKVVVEFVVTFIKVLYVPVVTMFTCSFVAVITGTRHLRTFPVFFLFHLNQFSLLASI